MFSLFIYFLIIWFVVNKLLLPQIKMFCRLFQITLNAIGYIFDLHFFYQGKNNIDNIVDASDFIVENCGGEYVSSMWIC